MDDLLRIGVVRLRLVSGQELSVRADDILGCIATPDPTPEEIEARRRVAEAQAAVERQMEQAIHQAMQPRDMFGLAGAAAVGAGEMVPVNRVPVMQANGVWAFANRPALRPPPTAILLRGATAVYEVLNSREEIEGWMRDSR